MLRYDRDAAGDGFRGEFGSMANSHHPRPHASLDKESRGKKARKIALILQSRSQLVGARVLDVGAGSGDIATYFSEMVGPSGAVSATDRVNQMQTQAGIDFHEVADTRLPFPECRFDIVVSNHVIEHVGDRNEQAQHLCEIHRVLDRGGILYLAMPNRWSMVEPHYKLPFLSWLPANIASWFVRAAKRGEYYDCAPLSAREARELLARAGFNEWEDATLEALRLFLAIEWRLALGGLGNRLLGALAMPLMGLIPTFVFIARKDR